MLATLRKWAEFVKISHTIFALPFALASMILAARDTHGWPGWNIFLLILAAMLCARTCAMAFNRIVDRKFDALNPRTAKRHLPAGQITLLSAWTLCLLSAAGLVAAAWLLNPLCFYLSPVALFLICFYSMTKRFTDFTHIYLGLALAIAPIGAWLAVRGSLDFIPTPVPVGVFITGRLIAQHGLSDLLPLLMAIIVIFWLIGFDIIYAIQDIEFDRKHGLHSLVVRWGTDNALKISLLAHLIMSMLLALFGLLAGFKLIYWIGLAIILACLFAEHWLAKKRSLNWVNNAFFRLNALVSMIFLFCVLTETIFPNFRILTK